MESLPLVTVVVSCFNHANYVEECILSILNQSWPNIELLVVDDGSSDDSVEVISKIQGRYGFDFRVQENKGLSRTLNETFARSSGEYLVAFGSDDVMLPERIKRQVEYMRGKPLVGICSGNILPIDSSGRQLKLSSRERRRHEFMSLNFEDVFLSKKPFPPAATMMIRRSAFYDVGGFDPEIPLEDLQIWLKVTHAGYTIDSIPEFFSKYRKHNDNTYKKLRFMAESALKTYGIFKDHPLYEQAVFRYKNSMIRSAARVDKEFARELVWSLPIRGWNRKTIKGLLVSLVP